MVSVNSFIVHFQILLCRFQHNICVVTGPLDPISAVATAQSPPTVNVGRHRGGGVLPFCSNDASIDYGRLKYVKQNLEMEKENIYLSTAQCMLLGS